MSALPVRRRSTTAPAPAPDRLWPALARRPGREPPPRGLDVLGEWARAMLERRRAGPSLRRRGERIVRIARDHAELREADFDRTIGGARERVIRAPDDAETIDRCFAVAWEIIRREIGIELHVEQVMGALVLASGACAEMATGEGKTLTAVPPAILRGWLGRGVHVITANDYLARRDAETTLPAYRRAALRVGVLQDATPRDERRLAYDADVTYAADKQVIFDYLRDRLVSPLRPRLAPHLLELLAPFDPPEPAARRRTRADWSRMVVQRGLEAAIVDEADSVLIDEAVTPAVIGKESDGARAEAGDPPDGRTYHAIAWRLAGGMSPGEHYRLDPSGRTVLLTERGRGLLAQRAEGLPPFWAGPRRREELVTRALVAKELYRNGDQYIVRDGKIVIVDASTGRILEGRKWQDGLHQMIEAKEGLPPSGERRTIARISYQRFFQRYRHLSGMTGTAWEVAGEMWRYYRLPVVRIPTHRPIIRRRARDRVYNTEREKFEAVADRVAEHNRTGRPVLVGTRSVEASEAVGALLAERGVSCRILNATREAEEAEIVAEAGRRGAVTVATNMAGRGTDIILEPRARELCGLVVIATERNDERRVDRQLYGRSGRQGDPGLAETYVALDDSLIRRFGAKVPVRLLPRARGPLRRAMGALLWGTAQWTASRRAVSARTETSKIDAWIDLAMQDDSG